MGAREKNQELFLPEHHGRWVRVGIIMGVVGYGSFAVLHLLMGYDQDPAEYAALVVFIVALSLYRFAPRVLGGVALATVWLEVVFSLLNGPHGIEMVGMSFTVLPVIVLAASQLLGSRWAWIFAAATGLVVPISLAMVRLSNGMGISGRVVIRTVILEIALLGTAALVTSFFRTISELMSRERETTARVHELIEDAPDAIVVLDSGGTIQSFNGLAAELLGTEKEGAIGEPLVSLQNWPIRPLELPQNDEARELEAVDIGDRCVEVRIRRTGRGALNEWTLILRDVSERKRAEAKAKELAQHLEHAHKMEAIGQLAGGVAHDFNNLLTAVAGGAFILQKSGDKQVSAIAEELEAATERGAALTRQLLTFARRDVVRKQVVDVTSTVEGLQRLVARLVGERVILDIHGEPDCTVLADQGQIEQIVLNLAANSRDAMSGRGTFSVNVRREEELVILETQDTGQGIDEEALPRIFEPFFSTKPRAEGTGLGLSTVHGIVTKWDGTIDVETVVGKGTSFRITFPLIEDTRAKKQEAELRSQPIGPAGHVLFVEDDEHARKFLVRLLERGGHQVSVASNGEEAWLMIQDGLRPDILVSDVIMPGITGVELATRVREKYPALPLLLISGYLDDVLKGWPFDTTEDLLLKPFGPQVLLQRVSAKLKTAQRRIQAV